MGWDGIGNEIDVSGWCEEKSTKRKSKWSGYAWLFLFMTFKLKARTSGDAGKLYHLIIVA